MLDLVSSSDFREIVNGLLKRTGARLAKPDCCHPSGRSKRRDWTEAILEDYLGQYPLQKHVGLNRKWWIPFTTNCPNWDLVCHVIIDDKPGLLIVEAKAHHGEMSEKNSKSPVDKKSDRSIANDLSIRLRLAEANIGLSRLGLGEFRLSADHDYQLSNRLAYLHKLASDGIPTILMYLGWTGSPDWETDPFRNRKNWKTSMKSHFERIGPWKFVEKKHLLETGASLQMIVRSISPDSLNNEPANNAIVGPKKRTKASPV